MYYVYGSALYTFQAIDSNIMIYLIDYLKSPQLCCKYIADMSII